MTTSRLWQQRPGHRQRSRAGADNRPLPRRDACESRQAPPRAGKAANDPAADLELGQEPLEMAEVELGWQIAASFRHEAILLDDDERERLPIPR